MAVFSGNGSTSSPSFTFSSDTDTGFYRYGDGDIGITLNGTLRARFEGSALNISNAAVKATAGVDQNLYVADNVSNAGIFVGRWAGAGDGCVNDFFANRGANVGTYTAPTNGDELCRFRFFTHDTTAFREVAGIFARVGTYNGTDDVGGQIVFGTRPTGAGLNNREVFKITEEAYLRMASGSGGIQFNGDGAAANALDDYEEGTWVGSLQTTNFTLSSMLGEVYTKVGRTVTASGYISYPAGTSFVDLKVFGLPFAVNSNSACMGLIQFQDGATFGGGVGRASANGTFVERWGFTSSPNPSFSGTVHFSITYHTD